MPSPSTWLWERDCKAQRLPGNACEAKQWLIHWFSRWTRWSHKKSILFWRYLHQPSLVFSHLWMGPRDRQSANDFNLSPVATNTSFGLIIWKGGLPSSARGHQDYTWRCWEVSGVLGSNSYPCRPDPLTNHLADTLTLCRLYLDFPMWKPSSRGKMRFITLSGLIFHIFVVSVILKYMKCLCLWRITLSSCSW